MKKRTLSISLVSIPHQLGSAFYPKLLAVIQRDARMSWVAVVADAFNSFKLTNFPAIVFRVNILAWGIQRLWGHVFARFLSLISLINSANNAWQVFPSLPQLTETKLKDRRIDVTANFFSSSPSFSLRDDEEKSSSLNSA